MGLGRFGVFLGGLLLAFWKQRIGEASTRERTYCTTLTVPLTDQLIDIISFNRASAFPVPLTRDTAHRTLWLRHDNATIVADGKCRPLR